jgi:hypothetical protein
MLEYEYKEVDCLPLTESSKISEVIDTDLSYNGVEGVSPSDITEFTESQNSFESNKIDIFNIEDENKVDLVDNKDEEENDTEIDNEENKNIKQFFIVICKRIFAYISNLFTI